MNETPSEVQVPETGRLAGIDFGTVRIGIATCDPSQNWVTPLGTYQARNKKLDGQHFLKLASDEALVGWVIGLPIHCDGKESQKSKEVREFGAWLANLTELPIAFYDERFTTREARRLLQEADLSSAKKKKRLDQLAAHLILSHFLDHRANRSQAGSDLSVSQNEALDDG
ncbi:MAG: Holliday junction resolvase RuvX [Pirellulaceae bacterium]